MKFLALLSFLGIFFFGTAQMHEHLNNYSPKGEYENISVSKTTEDEHQSCFIIWVKNGVRAHYHAHHTENIVVVEGEAIMKMADSSFTIRKGDFVNIPQGTVHSVEKVLSDEPLKVLSIQSPQFDGSDRVFVDPKE